MITGASVATAKKLKCMRLRFIGVVNTASCHYTMTLLSSVELSDHGDHKGLVHLDNDDNPYMMAFVWMDRERRYFIANCSSLFEGEPRERTRWRQSDDMEAEPGREELTDPTPMTCNIYYDTCAAIDHSNRHRQDNLQIERKIERKNWAARVGTSFGNVNCRC
ncbi:hypothetical protein IV203_019265 [Nitzschia inconspicua]|uniref:Uncharacterized protein n=1 Tax=Nitzschia inconspicua TaxID=303405 RepID=A0A9K3LZH0_9STRA|nr:hypothetical protein IV203_019265 [Nitzschia inconspicua]